MSNPGDIVSVSRVGVVLRYLLENDARIQSDIKAAASCNVSRILGGLCAVGIVSKETQNGVTVF